MIQSLEDFQPMIALQGERDAAFRRSIYEQLLDAPATIASPTVPIALNLA